MKKMRTYTFPFAIAYADTDAGYAHLGLEK